MSCTAEDCRKRRTCCRRFETALITLAVLIVLAGVAVGLYYLITYLTGDSTPAANMMALTSTMHVQSFLQNNVMLLSSSFFKEWDH